MGIKNDCFFDSIESQHNFIDEREIIMGFINGLFALLTLIFFVLIFVGLIKPSLVKMPSRGKAFLVFFIAFIVSTIIFSVTSSDEQKATYEKNNQKAETSSTTPQESQSTHQQNDNIQEQPTEPVEQIIKVTADQLFAEYDSNEIAANQKFKGQKILVTGTVDAIQADFSDKPVISLRAGGEYNFLLPQASLAESEESKAAQLGKGQRVSLLCIGDSEVGGMAMLSDCYLQ